ncbi:unnamed protein product [Ambrosiozyma monospora]|uniref:Unnamed protein product n=1 Tax=Ambrosiozyma monospora TaxID=43982 RepID=A0ACB5T6J1_AMBMO|nr:unnamed protein product [Ambrosiozyma monospora]
MVKSIFWILATIFACLCCCANSGRTNNASNNNNNVTVIQQAPTQPPVQIVQYTAPPVMVPQPVYISPHPQRQIQLENPNDGSRAIKNVTPPAPAPAYTGSGGHDDGDQWRTRVQQPFEDPGDLPPPYSKF